MARQLVIGFAAFAATVAILMAQNAALGVSLLS
jgi:hypothetical protein